MTLPARLCPQTGMTLMELLVALAVFAILAAAAYSGLGSVLSTQVGVEAEARRLANLQTALHILERDLDQVAPRAIRDEFGQPRAAMVGNALEEVLITFTRAGWSNPLDLARPTLQRVFYRIEDDQLVRGYWNTLDRGRTAEPRTTPLLDAVDQASVRFLDARNDWLEEWPPLTTDEGEDTLPRAVEIRLTLSDWGEITRLFRLPRQ